MGPSTPPSFTSLEAANAAARLRPQAAELRERIAAQLRESFARILAEKHEFQGSVQDPTLATLFLAVADQLAPVYEAVEKHLPDEVLDGLMRGLDLPARAAAPSQLVARFTPAMRREPVARHTPLSGLTAEGGRFRFTPEHAFVASPTRLVFAAVLEPGGEERPGTLHALPGAEPAPGVQFLARHVPCVAERSPTLYLAFHPADGHLDRLALFVEAGGPRAGVIRALQQSVWQFLEEGPENRGRAPARGALVRRSLPGTINVLEWLEPLGAGEGAARGSEREEIPRFPGHFAPMVWVFPEVPPGRRLLASAPEPLRDAAKELLPEGHKNALDLPLAWVRVPLGEGGRGAASAIRRIVPHCMVFSNVEVWSSERIELGPHGGAVDFSPEGSGRRHLVGVLEITGEGGTRYLEEDDARGDESAGRYRVRGSLLELSPHRAGERADAYARVRLLVSDAEAADGVEEGQTLRVDSDFADATLEVTALTPSRGGRPPPDHATARRRFAEALRTRERLVTVADVEAAVRAFDPRVSAALVEGPRAERGPHGLRPVTGVLVRAALPAGDDREADLELLAERVEAHLRERALFGQTFRVRAVADD